MLWIVALGIATGARSMTAIAVVCWFGWLQLFHLEHTWAFWVANLIAVIVFTLLALGEYVGDTLPKTPMRTSPGALAVRLVFAGLVGAVCSTALMEPLPGGIILGIIGALIGAYGGVRVRLALAERVGRDLPVAIGESIFVLALSLLAAYSLHVDSVRVAAQEGRTFF